MSHHLVEPTVCTPAAGWEKGQVENQVGFVRRRLFSPRLKFKSYEELSTHPAEAALSAFQETAFLCVKRGEICSVAMSGDDFERRYDVVAETRRRWSLAEKQEIVAQASVPCANISAVARRHGLKPALLYRWKKELGDGGSKAPALLPVTLTPASSRKEDGGARHGLHDGAASMVEIELGNGRIIRVPQEIDADALLRLVSALET